MDQISHLKFAFSISGNQLGPDSAKILAEMLRVSTSMNKLNILGNSIGDEGYEVLMKLAEEKGMLTFCGFEEGQIEADLSKKNLGPIEAKLIAHELTTGYVSTSMTFLNFSSNCLCGLNEYGGGTYDATGIKAIADALSVSSSLKILK